MDPLGLRDIIYLGVILVTAVVTFLTTKHKLSDKIQGVKELLKEDLKGLEIEIERLKARDDMQQQVIEQFQKQVLDHMPQLTDLVKSKKGKK